MGIKQQTFLDYDGFCQKFETKKTTNDCYTPENVYAAVRDWCVKEYNLAGREIVRPFWPGGDYEAYNYPPDCVVIDNPPFSIVSKIAKWYAATGVSFFLFSPYLTNFSIGQGDRRIQHIIAPCSVTYENSATVDTCFVTNLDPHFIRSAPDLMDAIEAADKVNRAKDKRELPKYEYPDAVITSARIGYLCKHHTPLTISADDCAFIRKIDTQGDKTIFGGGFLLSERAAAERAAAERAAAERAAAERAAAIRWQLSPREIEIQKLLGRKARRSAAK
jgi:hypothetical protein